MLIFGRGLKIAFWNVRSQRTEGIIKYKCDLIKDGYIVVVGTSGSCIVHKHQITDVLIKDFDGNDIWVNIDDLYVSFPNGSTITPLTKYNNRFDIASVYPIPASVKIPCPTINIEPIKDLSELANQYITNAYMVDTKREVKEMSIDILSFELKRNSIIDKVDCDMSFAIDASDVNKLEPLFKRARNGSFELKVLGNELLDEILGSFEDSSIKRRSGRYPWINSSGIKFQGKYYKTNGLPVPKKVIFNGPATVVLWTDNTKTVVKKSEDEPDDREKALMYCVFKKFLDDKKRDMDKYLKLFYKVLEEDKKDEEKKEKAGSSELHWKKSRAGSDSSESTV